MFDGNLYSRDTIHYMSAEHPDKDKFHKPYSEMTFEELQEVFETAKLDMQAAINTLGRAGAAELCSSYYAQLAEYYRGKNDNVMAEHYQRRSKDYKAISEEFKKT
jgi:hypothetical protein